MKEEMGREALCVKDGEQGQAQNLRLSKNLLVQVHRTLYVELALPSPSLTAQHHWMAINIIHFSHCGEVAHMTSACSLSAKKIKSEGILH